jgi:hypothetical protein
VPESDNVTLSVVCVTAYDLIRFTKTLDSVSSIHGNLELLVICPNDDSRTIELVKQESRKIAYPVKLIHDSGTGIYPAMNVGIMNCKGKYVMFWNSGDLSQGASVMSEFLAYLETCDADWGVAQGNFSWRREITLTHQNVMAFVLQSDGYISHQTVFAKKLSLKDLGGFNEKFRVSADMDVITKLFIKCGKPEFFNASIVDVEFPEFSGKNHRRGRYENLIICAKELPLKFKFRALGNAFRKEFGYARNRIFANDPKL